MKNCFNGYKLKLIYVAFVIFLTLNCAGVAAQPSHAELLKVSNTVIKIIKSADFKRLGEYVHEKRGLQFSPYDDVVEPGPDITKFSKQKLAGFMTNKDVITWGIYDGSGFDIKLTPREYYKKFIYDIDFETVANSKFIGDANTKAPKHFNVNFPYIFKTYPNASIAHYYYKGSEGAGFSDFKKLTLIFENIEKRWFLIGIMHGQKGV